MKLLTTSIFLLTSVLTQVQAAEEEKEGQIISVGLQKQLFVDDYVVAEQANVTRELGVVTKANDGKPLLVPDKPWETDKIVLGSVFRDGDKFRMFYKADYAEPAPGDPPGTPHLLIATAESTDGLRWTKPELGIRTFEGSKRNNLIDPMGMTCFLDLHETDPEHKYKAAYSQWQKMMAALAYSPDGLHWTPYNDGQPVTYRAADSINQLLWDEDAAVYRLYTREDYQGKLGAKIEVRGARDMTNPDVKADPANWKTIRKWLLDRESPKDYLRRQIYSLNCWLYEGIQFGLLWTLDWPEDLSEGPYDLVKRHEHDVMNCYLVTARGEQMWDLHWVYADRPLIPRGSEGSFDKDWLQPACNIVTWNDKHWIYYTGGKERHGVKERRPCAIGLATLRLDGFVCLKAKNKPGTVVTKPFKLEGSKLEVNVDAGNAGQLVVEVLDEAGNPMPGFGKEDARRVTSVDELRLRPTWRDHTDLDALEGKIVRLKFHLTKAKLYAFQIVDSPK